MTAQLTSQHRLNLLSVYITDLELEVDRLRKQLQQICQEGRELCVRETSAPPSGGNCDELRELINDVLDEVQSRPALDRIEPIMLRKLIESVFRWQQRLENRPQTTLVLSLGAVRIDWFPIRLRQCRI
jgi:hypothetical protein